MTDGKAPKVSAIIIFLNGEKYLAEAIESVLAQTLADLELILVDDGSTDGATAIARGYAERLPGKVRYAEHPGHENRGMSASRNLGIALARGQYLGFLDADDVWLPERLQAHVAVLDAQPEVALVVGPTIWWWSWSSPQGSAKAAFLDHEPAIQLPRHRVIPAPEVALWFLETYRSSMFGICSVTSRRSAVLEAGGFDDSFRTLYEDQVFLFRMCLRFPVWVLDKALDRYRQHPESTCHMEGGRAGDLRMRPVFLSWLQGELVDMGVRDERLWRAFRMEQMRIEHPRLWWWTAFPDNLRQAWNLHTRRLAMRILTPRGYNFLRRKFGLSYVHEATVR